MSKQGLGAVFVHALNLAFSIVPAHKAQEFRLSTQEHNPCMFYFLNVFLDTTIGVFILFLYLKVILYLIGDSPDFKFGFYGTPPRFIPWLKQTMVYTVCLIIMKLCVLAVIITVSPLHDASTLLLSLIAARRSQVLFVMFIFPLFMSIIQYWLIDHIIKEKNGHTVPCDLEGGKFGSRDLLATNDAFYDKASDNESVFLQPSSSVIGDEELSTVILSAAGQNTFLQPKKNESTRPGQKKYL